MPEDVPRNHLSEGLELHKEYVAKNKGLRVVGVRVRAL